MIVLDLVYTLKTPSTKKSISGKFQWWPPNEGPQLPEKALTNKGRWIEQISEYYYWVFLLHYSNFRIFLWPKAKYAKMVWFFILSQKLEPFKIHTLFSTHQSPCSLIVIMHDHFIWISNYVITSGHPTLKFWAPFNIALSNQEAAKLWNIKLEE